MKRGLLHAVVGMLIVLIGAGPACACVAGGMMPAQARGPSGPMPMGMTDVGASAGSDMAAMPAMAGGEHSCCAASEKSDQAAAPSHDESCPHCQAMATSIKAVQDFQNAATWGSLHLVATVPVALDVPAAGAINVAVFSPVWSPPLLLDDLFHSFCLLTV